MKKEYIIGIVVGVALITVGIIYSQKKPAQIPVSTPTVNINQVTLPTPDETPLPNSKIKVTSPQAFETISSPVTITGQAVGNWYFEASFPISILDATGKVLAQVPAQAQGEWMTTDFVPFSVKIPFIKPTTATGSILLQKDNPSGLPEHDESVTIPVKFSLTEVKANDCIVSGCSGQICASENMLSDCQFKPEYACYKTATCEKQSSGQCGWTPSQALTSCLNSTK